MIETKRMTLKPTGPEYFDGLWSAIERSADELRVWMAWAIEPDPKNSRQYTIDAAKEWEEGSDRHFTLFLDDEVCGQCSLMHADLIHSHYEIGYWMRSDVCGQGLMTEGASAIVDYGFTELGAHRIELRAGVENAASNRIAEKLGFQREGVLRDGSLGVGGYYDVYAYGLLESDLRTSFH